MRNIKHVVNKSIAAAISGAIILTLAITSSSNAQSYTVTVGNQLVPHGYQQPIYGTQTSNQPVSIRHQHKYQEQLQAYQQQQQAYQRQLQEYQKQQQAYQKLQAARSTSIQIAPTPKKVEKKKKVTVARATTSTSTKKYTLPRKYQRQLVDYHGKHKAGTIVVNTKERLLYHVLPGNKAMRYGIGVARPGFEWSGFHKVTRKKKWPSWTPPAAMRKREPHLPKFMPGGPDNPMGARALYLGSTLYRIHGSNAPWTIGQNVSSGCIRMTNDDVIHLYKKIGVGARVYVI